VAIRVGASTDAQWLCIPVQDERSPKQENRVQIDREVLNLIMQEDPRPPELILDLIVHRAVRRMPVPNGEDGMRMITPHNLELVWPT
jgi:hypothetical protein